MSHLAVGERRLLHPSFMCTNTRRIRRNAKSCRAKSCAEPRKLLERGMDDSAHEARCKHMQVQPVGLQRQMSSCSFGISYVRCRVHVSPVT